MCAEILKEIVMCLLNLISVPEMYVIRKDL